MVEHRHPVRGSLPLANQDGSRLGLPNLRLLRQTSNRSLFGDPREQATGRKLESPVSSFLETIRDRARQEGPADFSRRRPAEHDFPASAELVNIELQQARDFSCERLTVHNRGSPLHKPFSGYLGALRSALKSMYGPPLGRKFDRSNDTPHMARFAARSQSRRP